MTALEENPIYQQAQRMRHIEAELKGMSPFDRQQVRLLATTTVLSWAQAIEAVKARDYRARPLPVRVTAYDLANLNLPTPSAPRGRKLTRRQRRVK
jgi:hypothetical protein